MADVFDTLKKTWMKTIEVVGDTATNLADSAKNKVNEMNLATDRKELLFHCGELVYDLWLKGEEVPQAIVESLEKLKTFDEALAEIETRKKASEKADIPDERASEDLVAKTKEVLKDLESDSLSTDDSQNPTDDFSPDHDNHPYKPNEDNQ